MTISTWPRTAKMLVSKVIFNASITPALPITTFMTIAFWSSIIVAFHLSVSFISVIIHIFLTIVAPIFANNLLSTSMIVLALFRTIVSAVRSVLLIWLKIHYFFSIFHIPFSWFQTIATNHFTMYNTIVFLAPTIHANNLSFFALNIVD